MVNTGNDGSGDIPERDLWRTKQELFDRLNEQYKFEFDCCANESNKKCVKFSNDFERMDNLTEICWMNPPFSKAGGMFKHFFKVVSKGVAIYRCDNLETSVWQDIVLSNADWVFIPRGRISYTPFETGDMRGGKGTRFPSALIGVGVMPPRGIIGHTLI